jgi:transcriptional regulator
MANRELKKGSAELLVLSLLAAHGPAHGYELSKLIQARSGGTVRFNVASLYPVLYKLEKKGWVQAKWVEKAGQRRRRTYRITAAGTTVLKEERRAWEAFVGAVLDVIGPEHA